MSNQDLFQVRQGDLFFEEITSVPKGVKKLNTDVLAYGEVTGHAHRIISPALEEMDNYIDEKGDIFLYSDTEDIVVDHDEHGALVVAPKGVRVHNYRQREYDPVLEMQRQVAD